MKKILLLCLTLLLTGLCAAQTPEETAFMAKDEVLTKELVEAVRAKNYAAAECCCQEQLVLFDAQAEPVCEKFAFLRMGHYYNLACMQSLQGKRKAALRNFALACENGYDDYSHVLKDTDLDNIRSDKNFRRLHEAMRATSDFLYMLQHCSEYVSGQTDSLPHFSYQSPNDRDLVRVRAHFKLDSVAGAGDELSKIRNLLTFVHNTIQHDGQHGNPPSMNSITLAEACKDGSRGLNCRGLATVLNECYLALGFPSRVITCLPAKYIADCHVINAVYSATLDKWLWVDPTQNAWVMDENGVMLSIAEVRERLRDGRELQLNKEANWNNIEQTTKEEYLESYMAKNLFCIQCADRSRFSAESPADRGDYPNYTLLYPEGFTPDYPRNMMPKYRTTDDGWFWQSPYKE